MPVYCFRKKDGSVIDRIFPINDVPKQVVCDDGEIARRDFQSENKSIPATSGWPLECVASGVHADDAGELREYLKKSGVPTDVSSDGNPIYRDAKHRDKALKARGLFDKDSYN